MSPLDLNGPGEAPTALQQRPRRPGVKRISLALQGGSFTPEEAGEFRASPFAEDAIRIRRWDEAAKVPGLETPPLEHYRATLQAGLRIKSDA